MRKTFILFSLLMLVAFAAQAQRRGGQERLDPKEQAAAQAVEMQEELGLSNEQYKKTYAALLASAETRQEKMQEMRSSGSFDRESMRSALEELQEDLDESLKKVFSDTQWTAYEKWKEDRAQRGRRGGGRGGL